MCAIVGALLRDIDTTQSLLVVNKILHELWAKSHERGRDGRGYVLNSRRNGTCESPQVFCDINRVEKVSALAPNLIFTSDEVCMIGNLRAEPTTEYVADKQLSDQQPYQLNGWSIVHNGTIANDKQIRTGALNTTIDSAAIAELLVDLPWDCTHDQFNKALSTLKGSFAILATHANNPSRLFTYCNYRPIWYVRTDEGFFFASSRDYLPQELSPTMVQPYTCTLFRASGSIESKDLYSKVLNKSNTALVVCSGGMDSVVAATFAKKRMGMDLHLIHFQYGSRAEGPEVEAVKNVAKYLDAQLTLFPLNIYDKSDSALLDPDSKVAGGEEGAEFAHEWVPARNIVMLSVATAFAEARGYNVIVLGNNLEEAGAYPDNEPEFIHRFNDILPFAVGDGRKMEVIMPVGNLMKHEIVKLGEEIKAPMHLTWSCYRAGQHHCGKCGPCFMRQTAYRINNIKDLMSYEGKS